MPTSFNFDVLIIGSGAAGLGVALSLPKQYRIGLISKESLSAGSSQYAQGGIAAVTEANDSFDSHVEDTMMCGAGLNDIDVVRFVVEEGPQAIQWLQQQGVQFTKTSDQKEYDITREGGHSYRRIWHVADRTGNAVIKSLMEQVIDKQNIQRFPYTTAIDLIKQGDNCCGVITTNNKTLKVQLLTAKIIVLATGGASSVYLHTTNPDRSSGDGISMAWRAGCRVANMEFNQFHPTAFYQLNDEHPFLISEVLRGEGGYLRLPNGERFMQHYDPRAELAPRDITARAIDHELKKHHLDFVYFDVRHIPREISEKRFPTIFKYCLDKGLDISRDLIPVVPAAHYTCGGVMTNQDAATDINYLYAVGEVAYTGLHGANRMASNSLLECIVFAARASKHIQQSLHDNLFMLAPLEDTFPQQAKSAPLATKKILQTVRQIMWDKVGIVRTNQRLSDAEKSLAQIMEELKAYYTEYRFDPQFIEAYNTAQVAQLIIESALSRQESRGLHFNLDYPELLSRPHITILNP